MSEGWERIPLGNLLNRSEQWIELHPDKIYQEVTIRLWGKGVVERRKVIGAEIGSSRRLVVRPQQFILSRIDARNGALGLVPSELNGAVVSNDFPVFDADTDRILPKYLDWLSKTRSFVEICKKASEGTTNRVRLKESSFLAMQVSLPPLAEQRRIVARIEELAAKIEEARGLWGEVENQIALITDHWLTQEIDPQKEEWFVLLLSNVTESMEAGWSPQSQDRPAKSDEWGVLKTTSVQWYEFHPEQNKAILPSLEPRPNLAIHKGDVLITRAGPRKRVGVVSVAENDYPRLMLSDKTIRVRCDPQIVAPEFLALSLTTSTSQDHLVQRKTGLADAQVNISQRILMDTPVAIPSLDQQEDICSRFRSFRKQVCSLQAAQSASSAEADVLLPAILDRAFQGKL